MTGFEKPLDFRGAHWLDRRGLPIGRAVKTVALLAVLLAYAVGFVVLYPIVQSSVSKSASEGNDPALIGFVGP